jgi:hypothetical protein
LGTGLAAAVQGVCRDLAARLRDCTASVQSFWLRAASYRLRATSCQLRVRRHKRYDGQHSDG